MQAGDTLDPKPYAGAIARQRDRFINRLCAALTAYDTLPPAMQFRILPSESDVMTSAPLLVASLSESERAVLNKLLTPTRLRLLLCAIAQHAMAPGLLNDIPKTGAPKDQAVRWAVLELWSVYEYATGEEPKAYPSPYEENGSPYAGGFFRFAKAVLGPTRIVDKKSLGSKIHAAYQDRRKLLRPSTPS